MAEESCQVNDTKSYKRTGSDYFFNAWTFSNEKAEDLLRCARSDLSSLDPCSSPDSQLNTASRERQMPWMMCQLTASSSRHLHLFCHSYNIRVTYCFSHPMNALCAHRVSRWEKVYNRIILQAQSVTLPMNPHRNSELCSRVGSLINSFQSIDLFSIEQASQNLF